MDDDLRAELTQMKLQVKRLQFALLGVVGLAAAVGAIAAVQQRTPQDLTVRSLTIVAPNGLPAATLSVDKQGAPELVLNDFLKSSTALLAAGGLTLTGGADSGAGYHADGFDINFGTLSKAGPGIEGIVGRDAAVLMISGGAGKASPSVLARAGKDNTTIELEDAAGFVMDLGSTSTTNIVSGGTHITSAASITMYGNDKDHKVIWQAPNP